MASVGNEDDVLVRFAHREELLRAIIESMPNDVPVQHSAHLSTIAEIYTEMRRLHQSGEHVVITVPIRHYLQIWDYSLLPHLNEEEQQVLFSLREASLREHVIEQRRLDRRYEYFNVYPRHPPRGSELFPETPEELAEMDMEEAAGPSVSWETDPSGPTHETITSAPGYQEHRHRVKLFDTGKKFQIADINKKKKPECIICGNKMRLYERKYQMPCCKQYLHGDCIAKALWGDDRCPLCRAPGLSGLSPEDILKIIESIQIRNNQRNEKRLSQRVVPEPENPEGDDSVIIKFRSPLGLVFARSFFKTTTLKQLTDYLRWKNFPPSTHNYLWNWPHQLLNELDPTTSFLDLQFERRESILIDIKE